MSDIICDDYFDLIAGDEVTPENLRINQLICFDFIKNFNRKTIFGLVQSITLTKNHKIEVDIKIQGIINTDLPSWLLKYIDFKNYYDYDTFKFFNLHSSRDGSICCEFYYKEKALEFWVYSYSPYVRGFPHLLVSEKTYLERRILYAFIEKNHDRLNDKLDETIKAINETREYIETIEKKFDIQFEASREYYTNLKKLNSNPKN